MWTQARNIRGVDHPLQHILCALSTLFLVGKQKRQGMVKKLSLKVAFKDVTWPFSTHGAVVQGYPVLSA